MNEPKIVHFKNGKLSLGGLLYKPTGKGPFPAVLYNHGSAPGMLNNQAAEAIGPKFAERGWVFFMPYRRGQGLSQSAGPYIGNEIETAEKNGGMDLAASTMVRLLKTDHLDDQLAALSWLKNQEYVDKTRIAVDGNSFGGIETVLGASKASYCAAVNASGGAQSWQKSPELQTLMKRDQIQPSVDARMVIRWTGCSEHL